MTTREPNDFPAIRPLRGPGPRCLWASLRKDVYFERLEGALYGRMAGCTLGALVEFWPIAEMAALAEENGDDFPPTAEWIGAAVRADRWGYMAPGWPECAAAMAHRDAYLSHRRQGIYGEKF